MTTVLKTTSFLILFVIFLGLFSKNGFAQKDTEQQAKYFADNKQYTEALPIFEDLINLYPTDKILNYYLGMCLVETKHFSEKTKEALLISLGDRTPAKSMYYLAQYFHASNNFPEAMNYYLQFENKAKNKIKKSSDLEKLIELCKEKMNPFYQSVSKIQDQNKTEKIDTIVISQDKIPPLILDKQISTETPEELQDSLIHFQINSTIKYLKVNQFKTESARIAFIKAWQMEQKLQLLQKETKQLRNTYNLATIDEQQLIANKILLQEKETYNTNDTIINSYTEARTNEIDYWQHKSPSEIKQFTEQIHFIEDSISRAKEAVRKEKLNSEQLSVTTKNAVAKQKPTTDIIKDTGISYKIQLGAYRKAPPQWVQQLFKKLAVIRKIDEYTDEKGITVYTVGKLKTYDNALQMRSQVRLEGVKEAFIAAYHNGNRITVTEARNIMEK